MTLFELAQRAARGSWRLPLVGSLIEQDYRRAFFDGRAGHYYGVFASFAEAARAVPATGTIGFDHAAAAELYRRRMAKASDSDYGPLYWLRRILERDSFVFDFGGHVGVSYHAWRRFLDYGPDLRWLVYDLPAITQAGVQIASQTESPQLSFTNDVLDGAGCSIFFSAGAIQYVDRPLPQILSDLGELPKHLLMTKLPLYDGEPFVTIQAAGKSFHPYRVFNRDQFIESVTALGYVLVDHWQSAETTCIVPFTRRREVEAYAGLYFTRAAEQ
jgi:putative methyltransferase (TIGR04325 family)